MSEAIMAAAIMQMNACHREEDSREWMRDPLEAIDEGEWETGCGTHSVFDWLEISDGPFLALRRTSSLVSLEVAS